MQKRLKRMKPWKLPSKAKIYEALTAMSSNRITKINSTTAKVKSSDATKTYTVEWNEDITQITSNDNGSFWQGYMGYPIIALLMDQGRLDYDPRAAQALANINWKQINMKYNNNYDRAVAHVLESIDRPEIITATVDNIYSQLQSIKLFRKPSRDLPPK